MGVRYGYQGQGCIAVDVNFCRVSVACLSTLTTTSAHPSPGDPASSCSESLDLEELMKLAMQKQA